MTFAAATCSCDECGIPDEVLEAARRHKRKATHNYGSNKRIVMGQKRELVGRFRGYSLWKFVLGCGGDPIVELRNSWRIVYVEELREVSFDQLSTRLYSLRSINLRCDNIFLLNTRKQSSIYSIGRGIIGSAAEEADRNPTHWQRGNAYFLPVQKDTGCGWICNQKKESDNKKTDETVVNFDEPSTVADGSDGNPPKQIGESSSSNYAEAGEHNIGATLCTLKANANSIEEDITNAPSWVVSAKEQFARSIESFDGDTVKSNLHTDLKGIHLTVEESTKIRSIVEEVLSLAHGDGQD